MHEVKATVPPESSPEIAQLAIQAGITHVSIHEVFSVEPKERKHVVTVQASTPRAKEFIDRIVAQPVFKRKECVLTSREVRAIIDHSSVAEITRPMDEPWADTIQDLWQLSHITPSYVARAAGGAILLANGIIENNPISIVVAALFLPFLAQILAMGIGGWSRDFKLMRHGMTALLVSTSLALIAGAAVAFISGGPIQFNSFKGPLASFGISAIIGLAAGFSSADDAGRRYLIGVAAAVQLAIFPTWFGAALVVGLPEHSILMSRILSFAINFVTICGMSVAAYAILNLRRNRLRG